MTDEALVSTEDRLLAENEGLRRVVRVLHRQVQRGGPSNIEHFAEDYFGEDADLFREALRQKDPR